MLTLEPSSSSIILLVNSTPVSLRYSTKNTYQLLVQFGRCYLWWTTTKCATSQHCNHLSALSWRACRNSCFCLTGTASSHSGQSLAHTSRLRTILKRFSSAIYLHQSKLLNKLTAFLEVVKQSAAIIAVVFVFPYSAQWIQNLPLFDSLSCYFVPRSVHHQIAPLSF